MSRRPDRGRRFAGNAPRFDITTLYGTSITYRWMATAGITKDGSNRISHWVDRVSGLDLVQGTGANQPLWVAAQTPVGTEVVHIDGTVRNLASAGTLPTMTTAASTLIMVIQHLADGWGPMRRNAGSSGMTYQTVTGNRCVTMLGGSTVTDGAYSGNYEVVTVNLADSAFNASPLTTQEIRVNSISQSLSGNTGYLNPGATSFFSVGFSSNGMLAKYADIIWLENATMSAQTVGQVERALKALYGVP